MAGCDEERVSKGDDSHVTVRLQVGHIFILVWVLLDFARYVSNCESAY